MFVPRLFFEKGEFDEAKKQYLSISDGIEYVGGEKDYVWRARWLGLGLQSPHDG
jgi:hypothetical protein